MLTQSVSPCLVLPGGQDPASGSQRESNVLVLGHYD